MLESELFALLEQTADAAYTVTTDGEICSWNAAASRLFGYAVADVLRRNVDELLRARDALGTDALAGGSDAATRHSDGNHGIPNFDLEVSTLSGERIWINVSTIVFDNLRTGRRLFVRLARDVTEHKRREILLRRMSDVARQVVAIADNAGEHAPVDPISVQERRVLALFAGGSSAAVIARKLKISPQTLRNHLHHINLKLRTHSRLEAVTHAQRRGLID
ncbi:MAG: PAS domain S-box protein [Gemmatimonadaceae bacterium]